MKWRLFLRTAIACLAATITGCAANGRHVHPDIQSTSVSNRIAGVREAAATQDVSAIPQLVDRLEDEDAVVRFAAMMTLEELTGRRLGFHPGAPPDDRRVAVTRWRRFLLSPVVVGSPAAMTATMPREGRALDSRASQ